MEKGRATRCWAQRNGWAGRAPWWPPPRWPGSWAQRPCRVFRHSARPLGPSDAFLAWATRDGTEGLTAAGSIALRDHEADEWRAALRIARRPGAHLDAGVLLAALGDSSDAIRGETFWHLALVLRRDEKLDERVAPVVSTALAGERPADPAIALPLELVGRLLGRAPTVQKDWIAALGRDGARAPLAERLADEHSLLATLERSELRALSTATRGDAKALERVAEKGRLEPDAAPPAHEARTVDGLPRGFVAGVLASTGCEPGQAHGLAAAEVTYGADGRPRQVGVMSRGPDGPLGRPPACEEAGRVLLASTLRDDPRPLGAAQTLLSVLEPDPLTCLAEEPSAPPLKVGETAPPRREGIPGVIKEPKRIKDVHPIYPPHAKQYGIRGTVVLDATISATGCMRSLEVTQSVPALDLEAIRAVSQWRYTPVLLDGVPVPIFMTVRINFKM